MIMKYMILVRYSYDKNKLIENLNDGANALMSAISKNSKLMKIEFANPNEALIHPLPPDGECISMGVMTEEEESCSATPN